MKTVLFACIHNAGRSQMAAALFNAAVTDGEARAVSAGTHPAECVHPQVVQVMAELGVDLSQVRPRRLTDELAASVDLLVTMGCGEVCPAVPGLQARDWPLPDPKGQGADQVRQTRDNIAARVRQLLAEL